MIRGLFGAGDKTSQCRSLWQISRYLAHNASYVRPVGGGAVWMQGHTSRNDQEATLGTILGQSTLFYSNRRLSLESHQCCSYGWKILGVENHHWWNSLSYSVSTPAFLSTRSTSNFLLALLCYNLGGSSIQRHPCFVHVECEFRVIVEVELIIHFSEEFEVSIKVFLVDSVHALMPRSISPTQTKVGISLNKTTPPTI